LGGRSESNVIHEISSEELRRDFFGLLGELEAGPAFDPSIPSHASWLDRLVAARERLGARTFAAYTSADEGIGFITLLFDHGPPGFASFGHKVEILDFGLFPEHRGRGVGSRLLTRAEEEARSEKFHCLLVATYARQHRAIAFYMREGFVPVATLPDVHGPNDEGMTYLRKLL
jgi:GNAT superfamily N-acetyltransferase